MLFRYPSPAKELIAKSKEYRLRKQLKTAGWLIVPAITIVGIAEYNIREQKVQADRGRIADGKGALLD